MLCKTKLTPAFMVVKVTLMLLLLFIMGASCRKNIPASASSEKNTSIKQVNNPGFHEKVVIEGDPNWPHPRSKERIKDRQKMVQHIRGAYDLDDAEVLKAMENVPRHWFVPQIRQPLAYRDSPLSIGHGQTISQPFMVAYMTSLLKLDKNKKVLEIGTGSGYQAAVLSEFTPHVYTIEILEPLAKATIKRLKELGYKTINCRIGDGYKGWPEEQPFDGIIVTCAPEEIPPTLIEQLKPGGRMVIPVGRVYGIQNLLLVQKDEKGDIITKSMISVRFVPMIKDKGNL